MHTTSQSDNPALWFIFHDNQLLIMKHADNCLPSPDILSQLKPQFIRQYKLGLYNDMPCYCAEIDPKTALSQTLKSIPLRKAFELLGEPWYLALVKAASIIRWDKNHQFCGQCGNTTLCRPNLFERNCPHCGLFFYPRISPSIIVLIKNQDKILMSRSQHFPKGSYGLIAGFVETGESIEDAVHREVSEEVNIRIKNLHYFGSQPWPFPDSLMIGFTADYESGELGINPEELEEAGWYRYDNLPGRPSSTITIAQKLIDYFVAEQNKSKHR